jgi:hypothetical protein
MVASITRIQIQICEPIVYTKCGSLDLSQPYTHTPGVSQTTPLFAFLKLLRPQGGKSRLEAAEIRLLRVVSEHRLIDHRHNEGITEELQTVDVNLRVKGYQTQGLQQPRCVGRNRFPKLLSAHNPRDPCRPKDANIKHGENSFALNKYNLKTRTSNRPVEEPKPCSCCCC